MSAQEFKRPEKAFRFVFGGLKTNATADALPPNKYGIALNVRPTIDNGIRVRPGMLARFSTGVSPILALRTYAAIGTQDAPRALAYDAAAAVWLDNGVQVGTLAAPTVPGASMLPFRPAQSPNAYMYVANGGDYQKFSAPDVANVVVASRVGIAELQTPAEAVATPPTANVASLAGVWVLGGVATTLGTAHRVIDIASNVFTDPRGFQYSMQVGTTILYQRGMVVQIGAAGNKFWVEDVYSSLPTPITVTDVAYFVGATGRCVFVPQNLAAGKGSGESLYSPEVLASLRRGALIRFSGGGEIAYVLSVTTGPDGSLAIETSTTGTHTAGETITILPAIQVEQIAGVVAPVGGAIIGEEEISYVTSGAGIGTATAPLTGLFTQGGKAFQPDDYLSFAVLINDPTKLIEAKILFDVSNGAYNQDYYYYTIRPSDLTGAVADTVTQLSAIQTIVQRALVDEEAAYSAAGHSVAFSSSQASPGSQAWTQILIPISQLTRVGSDESLTLQNLVSVRFQWNVTAAVSLLHDYAIAVWGGSQPDVGNSGAPYMYRIRARSSITGVKGNPSPAPRYGVNPRRQSVNVQIPGVTTDSQVDTLDIFRYGGSVTQWRFIGSQPLSISNTIFVDNFDDAAARAGDPLEFDNFEPWPSVDLPLNATALSVTGTTALVSIPAPTNVLRFLPGNLVRIGGQNAYTLWTRPTLVSPDLYLFQFVENAGSSTNARVTIYEPAIARQFLPYMWGPDANGTFFACGDPLRPGTLYFSKNYAPDAAPDTYNIEISAPSEPLLGGEIVDGLSIVGSSDRWWALYPQPDNPAQRYNVVQMPVDRGLAAPFGHCTDNKRVYFWAKDGIYSTTDGALTDADLSNLFPHEGVPGETIQNGPIALWTQPPDYNNAAFFRLAYVNGYLYATYQVFNLNYNTLVLNTRTGAWSRDQYGPPASVIARVEQTVSTLGSAGGLYDEILLGLIDGRVTGQKDLANDFGEPIQSVLLTMEFDGDDIRVTEQWGDLFIDSVPAAAAATLTLTPMSLNAAAAPPVIIPQVFTRVQQPVSVGGAIDVPYLGLLLQWSDDFTQQIVPTVLYAWQPSYILQPELIADRITDWDDAGVQGNKWWQGFVLTADTFNAVKGLLVRDDNAKATHPFTPAVQHADQTEIAYSFDPPFIAHAVRIEPTDLLPWKLYGIRWISQPTPEQAETWQTQQSTHGLQGYMHVRQVSIAYASVSPITLTVTAYDGTSPAPIVLPSSGGAVIKTVFPLSPNKGQLYAYRMSSPQPFQVYQDKCEVMVGAWGREDSYMNRPLVGSEGGDEARV